MTPKPPLVEQPKSWKKRNEERKQLKRKRKQEQFLKQLDQELQAKELETQSATTQNNATSHPSPSTVSIAVPGSILDNTQSAELRSYVAGQIARAACIFRVSEVVVYDDVGVPGVRDVKHSTDAALDGGDGSGTPQAVRGSSLQLARILQYLECPQYLRKFFFPLHKDLKYSGLLNPLDAPHHLRQHNVFLYREGVVVGEKKAKAGHSYVNVGLLQDVLVDKSIAAGVRVTVKMEQPNGTSKKPRGTVVSPEEPRRETGIYWGYNVRIAHSFAEIFTRCPYDAGYDVSIGTSDRGNSLQEVPAKSYNFNHLLIVFGGLKGLEAAVANDDKLQVDDPALLFDHYVNVLPKQGSRTIRTEEALLIALSALQEKLQPQVPELEMDLSTYQLPRSEDTSNAFQQQQQHQLSAQSHKKKKQQQESEELPTAPPPEQQPQNQQNQIVVGDMSRFD